MTLMSSNCDSSEYFIPAWGGMSVNQANELSSIDVFSQAHN